MIKAMLLKRLEMSGFKSFAGATKLEFPSGVTAVVGPNGSGKSNVIDAIRWLLGEREAKNLRGGKAEDLIFSGTGSRGRAGRASASLWFDNKSRLFEVDFDEVEIKRELERDGTSTYYINKSEVRLKELVEMLSKSRLGARGLTIIGQGNSDLFVRATPSERREMIEEILGLREFRLKRAAAERRLRQTDFNIEKAQASLTEIKPHLSWLRRQSVKWERRAEAEKELKEAEEKYFRAELLKIETEQHKLDPAADELKRSRSGLENQAAKLEIELNKVEKDEPEQRRRLTELTKQREEVAEKKQKLEREVAGLEVRLEIVEQEARDNKNEIPATGASGFVRELRQKIKDFSAEAALEEIKKIFTWIKSELDKLGDDSQRAEQKEKIDQIKTKLEEFRVAVVKLDKELTEIIKEEESLQKSLQDFTKDFREAFSRVEEKRREISKIRDEESKINLERERWQFKLADLKEDVERAGWRWREITEVKRDLVLPEGEELEREENKIRKLRGELAALGEIDETTINEARETEERYDFLSRQVDDLEKAAKDLRELIVELSRKIQIEFTGALTDINKELSNFFAAMFTGGQAKLIMKDLPSKKAEGEEEKTEINLPEEELKEKTEAGIEIKISLPKKKVNSLDVLSGGEKSLVSIATLFALVSVSPPPFLLLDEIDAPLDEQNAIRFSRMVKELSQKVQFIVVTHNRSTMEVADVLYGVTIGENGASKVVSVKMPVK